MTTTMSTRLTAIGIALAAAVVAAGLHFTQQPARHDRAAAGASQSVTAATGSATSASQPTAQGVFVVATANYLCLAATKVYPTPAALAAAYTPPTVIAGLSPAQVKAFRQQLATDRRLSALVKARIATGCHPTTTGANH